MDIPQIVSLVKSSIGITSGVRDTYLTAIASGVVKELEDEKGLLLEGSNPYHLMFCVDLTEWRYKEGSKADMPRNLQYRLHNLMIHVGGGGA
jgi:hypothetical protein